ncbi:MAG: hypothetical protein GEV10_19430 [Streptosporangiales bacterium]|nr:hypothetical protein [Streptosporangiales bacterium]
MLDLVVDELRSDLRRRGVPSPVVLSAPRRAVHLCSRWEGRAVYAVFGLREGTPSLLLKIDTKPAEQQRLRMEYEALAWHDAPTMRGLMPAPVALLTVGPWLVLAETALPGVPLHVILRRRIRSGEHKTMRDHEGVFACLATLHAGRTGRPTPFDAEELLRRLRACLPEDLPARTPFLRAVEAEAARFPDLRIPLLPGHGDLTPSNCLISGSSVGLTDWEGGLGFREPLTEIVVFLNHYARALPVRRHRMPGGTVAALRAFAGDGWLATVTARTFTAQLHRLGLPPAAARLLFVSALADLAAGVAPIAHGQRPGTRRAWSELLALYARDADRSLIGRVTSSPA